MHTQMIRSPRLAAVLLASTALWVSGAAHAAEAPSIKVTTTIKPIHALVASVMQGIGEPTLLVSGTASPHTFAMKPSDAKALNESRVFFRVSAQVEPFTTKVVEALPASVKVVTLADAPGVAHLPLRTSKTFERHEHHHDEAGHDEPGDHAAEDHDGHDDHHGDAHEDHDSNEVVDGHVWLDPLNAGRMVTEIERVLAEADPTNAERYHANAARLASEIETLKTDIARDLAPVRGKPFVVFHDAYQYFERRFELAAVGSITASPEIQPSAKRLSEIRAKITDLNATCVFAEPLFKPSLVAAVTEGTKARSGTLDPEGALLTPGPGAYATLLKNLASGLKACLAEGS